MKKMTLLPVIALTMMIFVPAAMPIRSAAQDQESTASLEETLTFLHDFIGSNGLVRSTDTFSNTIEFTAIEKCKVRITHQQQGKEDEHLHNDTVTVVSTFSLSDIDPFELAFRRVETLQRKVAPGYASTIWLNTTNQRKVVSQKQRLNNDEFFDRGESDIVDLVIGEYSTDGENQKRVIRALKHAIKLCGGKTSPF